MEVNGDFFMCSSKPKIEHASGGFISRVREQTVTSAAVKVTAVNRETLHPED